MTMKDLRSSSTLRASVKEMLRDGKLVEVSPGVFRMSGWYREDCQMYAKLGALRREETIALLEMEM